MKIIRVKYELAKNFVLIEYEKQSANGGVNEFSLKVNEEPQPEFQKVFMELRKVVKDIAELQFDESRITVIGVKFSYSKAEVLGATLTAKIKLHYSPQPLIINTPIKWENFPSGGDTGDEMQLMSSEMNSLMYAVQDEAEEFINGKRAQLKLF